MTKTIKHFSELPNWFQLSKYENAKKLDEIGWHTQFNIRSQCMILINAWSDDKEKETRFKEALHLIRETPIIDLSSDPRLSRFADDSINELKKETPTYTLAIHTMTFYELFYAMNNVTDEQYEQMENLFNPNKKSHNTSWLHDPIVSTFRDIEGHPLSINLTLPNSVLIEQFKKVLPKLRHESGTEEWASLRNKCNFDEWIRLGVLPCIDLKIWAKEDNVRIPNRVMADAIFSTGTGGEETIRKTVNPLVAWLLNYESQSIIATEAAIKITEEKVD